MISGRVQGQIVLIQTSRAVELGGGMFVLEVGTSLISLTAFLMTS